MTAAARYPKYGFCVMPRIARAAEGPVPMMTTGSGHHDQRPAIFPSTWRPNGTNSRLKSSDNPKVTRE
jgi:hypothetical protein